MVIKTVCENKSNIKYLAEFFPLRFFLGQLVGDGIQKRIFVESEHFSVMIVRTEC